MQQVDVTDRRLEVADPGDVLELALTIANHRLTKVQERHGAQLDAGDLALLSVEGETLDRAARIAKLAIDLDLDRRREWVAERQAEALVAVFERVCAAVPDLSDETRRKMLDVACEGIERLERTPLYALDDGLFPAKDETR